MLGWKLSIKTQSECDELFIDNVYKELETLMETVFKKHDGSTPKNRKKCHQIVDIFPMASRILVKIHEAINRRLRRTPTTSSPYFCSFKQEVQNEVFDCIWKQIEQNGFGHSSTSTNSCVTVLFTDKRKAVYLMNTVNDNGIVLDKSMLFVKEFEDESVAEVLFSEDKPFTFKYSFKMEVLTISFHYGYWNSFGVPQH